VLPHRSFQPFECGGFLAKRRMNDGELIRIDKLVGRGPQQFF
jgi:hypothetical protein